MPLTIAGIIQDRGYFEQLVEPRLDGEQVSYIGPVGRARRGNLLGGARALLHLVNFDEPFGFSVVEAMACGTPVIARRRGSMAEIVRHAENGFLVETLDEAVAAVAAANALDRAGVRASVEDHFDVERMVDKYLALYRNVVELHRVAETGKKESASPRSPAYRFRVGVNYWPARTAMSWWSRFDREEVAADFARIAACGLDSVRVFLTWEGFQPAPNRVDRAMLERLVVVADLAGDLGLALIPTLFTGHMSGVNWIPAWALGGSLGDRRFRVVSHGDVARPGLRNWYTDSAIGSAQALLAEQAAGALAGHEAVWVWDLGNENSNCVTPPTRASARTWLARLASAIRGADETALLTVGLHMEDLEEDRRLGPREASEACDLLSMHGYPIYAPWADGPTDEQLLPFLADVTRWLAGRGSRSPVHGVRAPHLPPGESASSPLLVEEDAAAAYTAAALEALQRSGCLGAMLWCYSDYDPALWESPPFDLAPHERTFGLWRVDGSPKPSVAVVAAFAGAEGCPAGHADAWIDIDRDEFLLDPERATPPPLPPVSDSRPGSPATVA